MESSGDRLDTPLEKAAIAASAYRDALTQERRRLDERDRLIAQAVRSGARLEEIAAATSLSRAAVSLAARRTLPPRPGRGGPYKRPRGIRDALEVVEEAAGRVDDARERTAQAKLLRDCAIVAAAALPGGVRATAKVAGLTPGAVSLIARSSHLHSSTQTA